MEANTRQELLGDPSVQVLLNKLQANGAGKPGDIFDKAIHELPVFQNNPGYETIALLLKGCLFQKLKEYEKTHVPKNFLGHVVKWLSQFI